MPTLLAMAQHGQLGFMPSSLPLLILASLFLHYLSPQLYYAQSSWSPPSVHRGGPYPEPLRHLFSSRIALSLGSGQSEETPSAKWDAPSGCAGGLDLLIPLSPWPSLGHSGCPTLQLNPTVSCKTGFPVVPGIPRPPRGFHLGGVQKHACGAARSWYQQRCNECFRAIQSSPE